MALFVYFLQFIFIIQITNIVRVSYAGFENYIAFNCGRPTLIFQNSKWIADYEQNCITDAKEIVAFCKRTFPKKNISSAEPAIENVKFSHWCDFTEKNCDVNIEIRPFKCLETNYQSDALTLPKDCLFAHLGGKAECKIYKDWVVDATKQCALKTDWIMKSYGMLFQCGKLKNEVTPMFFRGVEFVCCPKQSVKPENRKDISNEQVIYSHYLSNGVLSTENEEQKTYMNTLKELQQSENQSEREVINDFKNGELDLKSLWKTDPKLAKIKENILISRFRMTYNAIKDEYMANKERLLEFHDDRLKFLFVTKISVAMQQLERILKDKDPKVDEIIDILKEILHLLMIRKKEIIEELNSDSLLGSKLLSKLSMELRIIESNVTDLFNRLNQVPQHKQFIKQHLVMYLMKRYPQVSFENIKKTEKSNQDKSRISEIISRYKLKLDNDDSHGDTSYVHYDLGLNDKDQEGHHGHTDRKFIFDHESIEKQFGDKKTLYVLVFGTLVTAFVILLVGSLLIIHRHRRNQFKYSKTTLNDKLESKQMMHGFGIESTSVGKDMINGRQFNGCENPTYRIIHTSLQSSNSTVDLAKVHQDTESLNENLSSPHS